MAAVTRSRRQTVTSSASKSSSDTGMAPKSKSTSSKRKREAEADSHEVPLFSVSAVDGGAACTLKAVAQSSANKKKRAGAINLRAAAAVVCRSALVKSPAASRAALAKHRAVIDPALAEILETVGNYPEESDRTSLHQAVQRGNAVIVQHLIAAGADASFKDKNGATPLDLATDDTCREILQHHADILAAIAADPTALISAADAHCASLSASKKPAMTTGLSLREHQLGPSFFWATPAARAAIFTWARDVFIAQTAAITQPFEELPDDCAGDVLDFLETTMTPLKMLHVAMQYSSSDARACVCATVRAAIAVKATANLGRAAIKGDLATVQDCLSKGADPDGRHKKRKRTALMYASIHGHTAIVELLLKVGADVDAKHKFGFTSLISASDFGQTDVVMLLLEAGADMEIMNNDGYTALITAEALGHTDIIDLLLEAGADTRKKPGHGAHQYIWGFRDSLDCNEV